MMRQQFARTFILLVAVIGASHPVARPVAVRAARCVVLLDDGWQLFRMRDFHDWPSQARLTADQISHLIVPRSGTGWEPVSLPDDYVVRGEVSPEPNASLLARGAVCALGARECEIPNGAPTNGQPGALNGPGRNPYGGHGYLPLYPAWYRRTMTIPASDESRTVWLDFEGVYRDAVVFINGRFIDEHPGGYTGFRLNITSAVRFGQENTIAVFVDPRWFEGWWYEGGGIYRHVRLITTDPLQVAPWGTFVEAEATGPVTYSIGGDEAAARLGIHTTIRNEQSARASFTLVSQVRDAAGKVIASTSTGGDLGATQERTFTQEAELAHARLWSLEHPSLYTLATTVRVADRDVDTTTTSFGIRSLRFDPDKGFFLNGQHVEIQGMCTHQDFPGIGIGAPDNLWSWRIQKIKEMGANAYRCAHNPVAPAFYDAADRMGLLVMDETRHLGNTYFPKAVESTPYSDLSDVKAMVLQHRNHPSIIMWSMSNEEGQQRTPYGARIFGAMKAAVKAIDPTRPTTAAMNGGFTKEGFLSVTELFGINYHSTEFPKLHAKFPNLMIFGSEDTNAKSSRGTRATLRDTGLCSAYGDGPAPDVPGVQPWRSWAPVMENPFVAGQFVWTAFDYRGEPNPFSWPAVTSQTGAMDLCGFPKPVYYYWKAVWHHTPSVYVFPDWNFPKTAIGRNQRVRMFSNCERVELLLNGKSVGNQPMPRNEYLDRDVPYAPGTLVAIGYNGGREAARYTVHTTGAPAALRLVPQVAQLAANGEDIAPIELHVLDADGQIVPDADPLIHFSVEGDGTLAGVANGNPASHEANVAMERRAFRGLAMVLVRATSHPGAIVVRAHADGVKPARIAVTTTP
jgi:beta-galactosidase